MENKHTPGPWDVIPQGANGPLIARQYETGQQLNPKGLRLVCHVLTRRDSLSQDEANARLLAAAPDLLALVKEWEASLEFTKGFAVGETPLLRVRAAILKAQGGTDGT